MLARALLDGVRPLGLAVSGGSDSTALLVLVSELFDISNARVVTVDHGLRESAKAEVAKVAKLSARLKIPHDIISLDLAGGADLQARARAARYQALGTWAKEHGVAAVALGHTQDDVAETFLMRLARGSGVDGLAQMPERFERDGMTYLRPLLQAKRGDLRDVLRSRNIAWSDDPSNNDPRFARVRIRNAKSELETLGIRQDRLAQTAQWMRLASEVLENAAEMWIATHAAADHGDAVLDLDALQRAPRETALRVLARVLCAVSSNPYRPRLSALKSVLEEPSPQTLHGCLLYLHKDQLRITQELKAAQTNRSRWHVQGPLRANEVISPLGETGLSQLRNWRETALLPRRSLLSSPAIWQGDTVIAAPLAVPTAEWRATAVNPLHLSK